MKYIKKFENKEYQGLYWKVRIDEPYFSKSLKYLSTHIYPMPKGRYNFLKTISSLRRDGYVFIIFYNNTWEWEVIENEDTLKDLNYKDSTKDLDIVDLKIQSKKYNL